MDPDPSSALILSTKPRIGSRLVGRTSIILQSNVLITGAISFIELRCTRSTRFSATSTKSVCGNSLKTVMISAFAYRRSDRWLCGSNVAPMIAVVPTISRTALNNSPSQSRHPCDTIAPCKPSKTISTGIAALSSVRSWSRKNSQVCWFITPPGSAQDAVPSTICQLNSAARTRAAG